MHDLKATMLHVYHILFHNTLRGVCTLRTGKGAQKKVCRNVMIPANFQVHLESPILRAFMILKVQTFCTLLQNSISRIKCGKAYFNPRASRNEDRGDSKEPFACLLHIDS